MTDTNARAALAARQEDSWCVECKAFEARHCGYSICPLRPSATTDHMPFRGHRTVAEVWADELRASTARGRRG